MCRKMISQFLIDKKRDQLFYIIFNNIFRQLLVIIRLLKYKINKNQYKNRCKLQYYTILYKVLPSLKAPVKKALKSCVAMKFVVRNVTCVMLVNQTGI